MNLPRHFFKSDRAVQMIADVIMRKRFNPNHTQPELTKMLLRVLQQFPSDSSPPKRRINR